MDIDWLAIIRENIGGGIAMALIALVVGPLLYNIQRALGRLGDIRAAIVEQAGHCDASRRAIERLCRQQEESNHRLATLQVAIRVAFAGRGNGHGWQEAKQHYSAAADILADQESDEVLRQIHERDTPPDPHDPTTT